MFIIGEIITKAVLDENNQPVISRDGEFKTKSFVAGIDGRCYSLASDRLTEEQRTANDFRIVTLSEKYINNDFTATIACKVRRDDKEIDIAVGKAIKKGDVVIYSKPRQVAIPIAVEKVSQVSYWEKKSQMLEL